MAQMRAMPNPQALQQISRFAATLLSVFAIASAVIFSFLFFSNVSAAWNHVHAEDARAAAAAVGLPEDRPAVSIPAPVEKHPLLSLPVIKLPAITLPALPHFSFLPEQKFTIVLPMVSSPGPAAQAENPPAAAQPVAPAAWDGSSRITMLVMGLDYRDWESGNVPRSDSMWVVTVDPGTHTAGMMSIPRDTWAAIPGFDYAKINMAYFFGEAYHTPGGGPALAMQTVSQFLGVPIQYFVVVDFNTFVKFIDKLDGITIDVPEEISVDPLGPGNTVVLEPGPQRIFGEVALGYARNRHTANGDFDRAKRQLQVIMGVRDRILDPAYLPVLVANAGGVYDLVKDGVRTNLSVEEAIKLAWLAQQVPPENIQRATLGNEQMIDSFSVQGWSIEIPIMSGVYAVRDRVFSGDVVPVTGETAPAPEIQPAAPQPDPETSSLAPEVAAEGARIMVVNGTATIGLAARTVEYLRGLGYVVLNPADAPGFYSQTSVVDYTGKRASLDALASLLHVDPARVMSSAEGGTQWDIAIVLGDDWATSNPMP